MKLRTYGALSLAMLTLLASGLKVGCSSESAIKELPAKKLETPNNDYSVDPTMTEAGLRQIIEEMAIRGEVEGVQDNTDNIITYINGENFVNGVSTPMQKLMMFDHKYNNDRLLQGIHDTRTDIRMQENFSALITVSEQLREDNLPLQRFVDFQVDLEERLMTEDVSEVETLLLLNCVFGLIWAQDYDVNSKVTINGTNQSIDEHARHGTFPNIELWQDMSERHITPSVDSFESNAMQIDWEANTVTVKNKSKLRV